MKAIQDTGLTCPQCGYNLTGLEEPHCPECGGQFTWQQVREHARWPQPAIAFEKARGWHKIPAFFATWLTMLFTPWVFARQVCRSVYPKHAFVFCALWISLLCALSPPAKCCSDISPPYIDILELLGIAIIGLLITMFGCILLCCIPALIFSLIDPALYRRKRKVIDFWYTVSLYTLGAITGLMILWYYPVAKLIKANNTHFLDGEIPLFVAIFWMIVIMGCCLLRRWRRATPR